MYDRNITEYFSTVSGNFRKMFGDICLALGKFWKVFGNFGKIEENIVIAAAASEPEANERGSSLISRRLHYRGLQSLFLTKRKGLWLCANGSFRMRSGMRKELWLCANGRFRMRSGMPHGIVVMREWEDLGCTACQSHV